MRTLGCVLVLCVVSICAKAQWYGGAAYPYPYPSPANAGMTVSYAPPSPSVIIVNDEAPPPPPPIEKTYMIAFKGGRVRLADQYWVDGGVLNYVTPDHERRTEAIETVDRTLSAQLNSEQGVEFTLPPAPPPARAEASRQQPSRNASNAVQKRKSCRCK